MAKQAWMMFAGLSLMALAGAEAAAQEVDTTPAVQEAAADAADAAAADAAYDAAAAAAAAIEEPFFGAYIDGLPSPPVLENYADLYFISALEHYPAAARAELREGTTSIEADIDAAGLLTACRVTESSGHADLDAAACATLTELGKFAPARDRDDQPVAGRVRTTMNWRIQSTFHDEYMLAADAVDAAAAAAGDASDEAMAGGDVAYTDDAAQRPAENAPGQMLSGPGSVAIEMVVDEAGKMTSCDIIPEGVLGAEMTRDKSSPCDRPPQLEAYRDANGNPVKRRVRLKIAVEIEPVG